MWLKLSKSVKESFILLELQILNSWFYQPQPVVLSCYCQIRHWLLCYPTIPRRSVKMNWKPSLNISKTTYSNRFNSIHFPDIAFDIFDAGLARHTIDIKNCFRVWTHITWKTNLKSFCSFENESFDVIKKKKESQHKPHIIKKKSGEKKRMQQSIDN